MLGQLDEQTKFSKKKCQENAFFSFKKKEGFVEKCPSILNGKSYKLDVKMFSYFIFSFKDVQDFFSCLPFCWIKHTAFSESLAVMYHERLQLFEELNLIKRERE